MRHIEILLLVPLRFVWLVCINVFFMADSKTWLIFRANFVHSKTSFWHLWWWGKIPTKMHQETQAEDRGDFFFSNNFPGRRWWGWWRQGCQESEAGNLRSGFQGLFEKPFTCQISQIFHWSSGMMTKKPKVWQPPWRNGLEQTARRLWLEVWQNFTLNELSVSNWIEFVVPA